MMAAFKLGVDSRETSVHVNFVCQRCCQPLRLDPSFNSLDEQLLAELTAPVLTNTESEDALTLVPNDGKESMESSAVEISKKHTPPIRLTDSGNGFMLVGDTCANDPETLSRHLKITSTLFDIMSDQTDIDHPLCEECADALLDQLDQQLKLKEDECKDYKDYLEKLSNGTEEDDPEALEAELSQLKLDEGSLKNQLDELEEERKKLMSTLQQHKEEKEQFGVEEERFWHEYCSHKQQLLQYEDEQRSVDNQLRYAQAQLDKLRKTNVFNATFHIWYSGHFGTINNFRLGRLPSVPVDWNEINAAWGQTVLLLHSLANKMDLIFQRYRLVPFGNHSYVESLVDNTKELPLYGSGGIRFFWDTKFDQAMVAFLDCLQQFKEELEKGDTSFCLPYRMDKGRIEDSSTGISYSIKIQFNSEEQWTKALKFMLTNLKWGLAWVSSQFSAR